MEITVSDFIVKYMEHLGIQHIFGMPGAHILPVYDSLYHSSIQTVLAKHEQGAAFMACGYVRASEQIAACITTAGPGATNLITGIANAYVDKQAILIITGETPTYIFGKGGLQESSGEGGNIEQVALFQSITRYCRLIERTDYLLNVLQRAAKILLSDNSGPVLLSFPFNIQKEYIDDTLLEQIRFQRQEKCTAAQQGHTQSLLQAIVNANNALIIAGYGCIRANAQQEVKTLSECLQIPVSSSLKAKGVVDENSPLALGSIGVTSYSKAYQYLLNEVDTVIILGAGFNERTSYVWKKELLANKTVIQIDHDAEQLEKVFVADLAIQGDIKHILTEVLIELDSYILQYDKLPKASHSWNNSSSNYYILQAQFPLVEAFFQQLADVFPQDLMVFDDNIIFSQNFFVVSADNHFYPNAGISSLGHAIPAAIGAGFIHNKKQAIAILGDGGFQMCCMEIMTAVNYAIPLVVVMFNNATMGLIRKNQTQQYDKRFIDCDFINPDYATLAKAFGMDYVAVKEDADLDKVFYGLQSLAQNKTNTKQILIDFKVDKDSFPGYFSRR